MEIHGNGRGRRGIFPGGGQVEGVLARGDHVIRLAIGEAADRCVRADRTGGCFEDQVSAADVGVDVVALPHARGSCVGGGYMA